MIQILIQQPDPTCSGSLMDASKKKRRRARRSVLVLFAHEFARARRGGVSGHPEKPSHQRRLLVGALRLAALCAPPATAAADDLCCGDLFQGVVGETWNER